LLKERTRKERVENRYKDEEKEEDRARSRALQRKSSDTITR